LIQKSDRLDSIVARGVTPAEFCNKIGTDATLQEDQVMTAQPGKADVPAAVV
jgi:hypothetical protein